MHCRECGNKLMGSEKYCPNCGKIIDNSFTEVKMVNDGDVKSTENSRSASIILGGISLGGVLLGIFAPISLILSLIGLVLAIKSNRNIKNTVGIVLNAIGLFLSFIITCIIALIIYFMVNTSKGIFDNLWDIYDNTYDEHYGDF